MPLDTEPQRRMLVIKAPWKKDDSFRLYVEILKEEGDEDYSALAANFPGATGCGATEYEAVESLKASARDLIALYRERGRKIPWKASGDGGHHSLKGMKAVLLDV